MLFILLFTFIIPLFLAGIALSSYIAYFQEKEEYKRDVEVLTTVSTELNQFFFAAEDISANFITKGLDWKFSESLETYRDYLTLAAIFNDNNRNIPAIASLILLRKNKVIFEHGPALDSDIPAYPDDLVQTILLGGTKYWTTTRKLNNFFNFRDGDINVLPYYQAFQGNYNNDPLLLFVGLDEDELCRRYSSYSRGTTFLINNDQIILSSPDKALIGTVYSSLLFSDIKDTSGFFRAKNNTVIFFARVFNNWYLVNHIPRHYYTGNRNNLFVILFLATFLGVIFAAFCLVMQKFYIFNPLRTMLIEMNQFREGDLQPKMSYKSGDEIGQINKEVESIFSRLNSLIHELYINKLYNQEAKLKILTSQINPHFLYNTLDSIHWKAVQNNDYEVSDQIEILSDLFRHVLDKGDDLITISQEIAHLENYLRIMNFRYGNRLNCTVSVDPLLMGKKIPKLILQPIVENSILHGIDKRLEDGKISVDIEKWDDYIKIIIKDNGDGTDGELIRHRLKDQDVSYNVFALKNIDQRIKLQYGDDYGIEFDSIPELGTTVSIIIPIKETAHEAPYPG
jgi:two-component system sensor histidine kinase YesM